MPYFVKKLAGKGKMRDGTKVSDPFVEVFDDEWVEFSNLPRGHRVGINHGDVEIVFSDEKDALEKLNYPYRDRHKERKEREDRVRKKIDAWKAEASRKKKKTSAPATDESKSTMEQISERTQQDIKKKPEKPAKKASAGRSKILSMKTK